MLGLGSSLTKINRKRVIGLPIVTDNLVLHHKYTGGEVHQVSTGAAYFDGTDDYIDVGDSDGIITGTNVTMACWFRLLDGDDTYLMTNKRGASSSNLAIRVNRTASGSADGHVSFVVWNGSDAHGDVSYNGNVDTSNKWHHIAVTTTSSAQKLYLDGVEVASGSNTFGNSASSDHMLLGNGPGSYFLKGYMCNAAVWNRVLSQAEVRSIMWKNYSQLTTAEAASLASWWNLDSTNIYVDTDDQAEHVLDNNSSLGSNLYEYDNGDITGIVARGNNTIESDDGAVKINFVDDDDGARWKFSNPATLTSNLTDNSFYQLKVKVKINKGVANLRLVLGDSGANPDSPSFTIGTIDHTHYVEYTAYFKASHATRNRFDMENMDGAETIWVKDVSVKLVTGNQGVLS